MKPNHHTPPKTHPPSKTYTTQTLSNIIEDHEVEEDELLHGPHVVDTSFGPAKSRQNVRGANSSQNNGAAPHQSPLQALLPAQVIQEHACLTNTKSKIRRRKSQRTKLQQRRSSLEFSKRLIGFVRCKRPSLEGRQRLSGLKQGDSTLTEKEQD
jgi:hypothetical protein